MNNTYEFSHVPIVTDATVLGYGEHLYTHTTGIAAKALFRYHNFTISMSKIIVFNKQEKIENKKF